KDSASISRLVCSNAVYVGAATNTFGFNTVAVFTYIYTTCTKDKQFQKQIRDDISLRYLFWHWEKSKICSSLVTSCNFDSSHLATPSSKHTSVWYVAKRCN